MTSHADKKLHEIDLRLKQGAESPKAYFRLADEANYAGQAEKATRYLRMALTLHDNQILNQFNPKSIGETNNA